MALSMIPHMTKQRNNIFTTADRLGPQQNINAKKIGAT
jgi:hypothetical protein